MGTLLYSLLSQSSPIALGVLLLLGVSSILVWAILFTKLFSLLRRRRAFRKFLLLFESTEQFEELSARIRKVGDSPLKQMFLIGSEEVRRFQKQHPTSGANLRMEMLEMLERTLEAQVVLAERSLSRGQAVLASIAVSAPFVGLFGTVIGVIETFQSIAEQNAVDLSVISPGIAEALIATAAGLFAAIPAALGYNLLRALIQDLMELLDYFALRLLRTLQLQLTADEKKRV
ncbi:MAG: MotA/TolQ/ExbB proton channel family protein [bacterium]